MPTGLNENLIKVRYFAMLRDLAGKSLDEVAIGPGDTPHQVYEQLRTRYMFPLTVGEIRVAINDEFADFSTTLKPGDEVTFIPPVAGG